MRAPLLLLIPVTICLSGLAFAATPAYDGTYSGSMKVSGTAAKVACPTTQVSMLAVKDGSFHSTADEPKLDGFVNEKGFITGKMKSNGSEIPIQGRAEEINGAMHLSAGLEDSTTGCAWTMDLRRQ